jgi:aminoglycoside phosphotransferase (APT) family kinase protein
VSEGELLTGDGVTQGIVRIGDTVRRPLRPFSLTVQAYLAHLRDAGFTGAPLPFGVDEQGREMLSFVPGEVPRNPLPAETAGDDVLVALARLIRTLHEASAGWAPPPDAVWGGTPANVGRPVTERTELVSHRDYYPGNVVFRDGLPVALIDFDLAKPTTRLYDIANVQLILDEARSAGARNLGRVDDLSLIRPRRVRMVSHLTVGQRDRAARCPSARRRCEWCFHW